MRKYFRQILLFMFILVCFSLPVKASSVSEVRKQTKQFIKVCRKYNYDEAVKFARNRKKFYTIKDKAWNEQIRKIKKHDKVKITKIKDKGSTINVYVDLDTVSCYYIFYKCFNKELHEKGPLDFDRLDANITKKLTYYAKHWNKGRVTYPLCLKFTKSKGKWLIDKVNYDFRFMYDSGAGEALHDFSKKPFDFY